MSDTSGKGHSAAASGPASLERDEEPSGLLSQGRFGLAEEMQQRPPEPKVATMAFATVPAAEATHTAAAGGYSMATDQSPRLPAGWIPTGSARIPSPGLMAIMAQQQQDESAAQAAAGYGFATSEPRRLNPGREAAAMHQQDLQDADDQKYELCGQQAAILKQAKQFASNNLFWGLLHDLYAQDLARLNTWCFLLPLIALNAISSALSAASTSDALTASAFFGLSITTVIINLVAATLIAVQKFFQFSERSELHQAIKKEYFEAHAAQSEQMYRLQLLDWSFIEPGSSVELKDAKHILGDAHRVLLRHEQRLQGVPHEQVPQSVARRLQPFINTDMIEGQDMGALGLQDSQMTLSKGKGRPEFWQRFPAVLGLRGYFLKVPDRAGLLTCVSGHRTVCELGCGCHPRVDAIPVRGSALMCCGETTLRAGCCRGRGSRVSSAPVAEANEEDIGAGLPVVSEGAPPEQQIPTRQVPEARQAQMQQQVPLDHTSLPAASVDVPAVRAPAPSGSSQYEAEREMAFQYMCNYLYKGMLHDLYAQRLRAQSNYITVPVIIINVVVSGMVSFSMSTYATRAAYFGLTIAVSALNVVAAVLVALQRFLQLAEKARLHEAAKKAHMDAYKEQREVVVGIAIHKQETKLTTLRNWGTDRMAIATFGKDEGEGTQQVQHEPLVRMHIIQQKLAAAPAETVPESIARRLQPFIRQIQATGTFSDRIPKLLYPPVLGMESFFLTQTETAGCCDITSHGEVVWQFGGGWSTQHDDPSLNACAMLCFGTRCMACGAPDEDEAVALTSSGGTDGVAKHYPSAATPETPSNSGDLSQAIMEYAAHHPQLPVSAPPTAAAGDPLQPRQVIPYNRGRVSSLAYAGMLRVGSKAVPHNRVARVAPTPETQEMLRTRPHTISAFSSTLDHQPLPRGDATSVLYVGSD